MKITKAMGRACLKAMRAIEGGEHATFAIDADIGPYGAVAALEQIGWMATDRDYFAYRKPRGCVLDEYEPLHALTALALCVSIAENP